MATKIVTGECVICGKPIIITPRRGSGKTPNIFFCSKCLERRGLKNKAEDKNDN